MLKEWLISCLICTYNAESFIDATLSSVTKQSYTNIEILIRDDNSTDTTLEILENWKRRDNRIQIFYELWTKRGSYGWLNFLLDKSNWVYVAIQDHDDLWHKDKLYEQVSYLDKHSDIVWCGTKTLMRYESDQKGFEYYLWEYSSYALHPSLMFRNDKTYKYPKNVYMNDALFQKKILCKWKKLIYNINQTLTFHRVRDGGQNYSYQWFRFTGQNFKTLFYLHPIWYACLALWFECLRKIFYPFLHFLGKEYWIDKIERFPFFLLGKEIQKYTTLQLKKMWFFC